VAEAQEEHCPERRLTRATTPCDEKTRGFSGVGALWDCALRVCGGGGGCAGGAVPLGAVPVLS